jgi:hypothetical protein
MNRKIQAAVVLAVSCTSAQADVLSEANNLGYIAEEIRLQMEQGFKFAIGVTEGINQEEFAAKHAEQEYYLRTDQVVAFSAAYNNLLQSETVLAEEYLAYEIEEASVKLEASVNNFVDAATVVMAVVEVADEANNATTEVEAIAVRDYIATEGLGTVTEEMATNYNTSLTDVTEYARDISILTSVKNDVEMVDYLNYEFETYGMNPYEGTLTITASYDVLIDMGNYGLGIVGSSFFNSEKENEMFVALGNPIYEEMFGNY